MNKMRSPMRRIEIRLRNVNQLFNTMDPSPFHEKDLDADAEEFIVSWAQEFHLHEPLELIVHLDEAQADHEPAEMIEKAIRHYFRYRADMTRFEFRRMMRDARTSLLIGTLFLGTCLLLAELLVNRDAHTFLKVLSESLTICGWVAMWRPLQMYLYDWWPVRRRWRVFEKMSQIAVRVVNGRAHPAVPIQQKTLDL